MDGMNDLVSEFNRIDNSDGKKLLMTQYSSNYSLQDFTFFDAIKEINFALYESPFPEWFVLRYKLALKSFLTAFDSLVHSTEINNRLDISVINSWVIENWNMSKDNPGIFFSHYETFNSLEAKLKSLQLNEQLSKNEKLHEELVKKTTQKLGDEYVKTYNDEAERNQISAEKWFKGAIGVMLVFFAVVIAFVFAFPTPTISTKSYYSSLLTNYIITKALSLSIIIFILSWCLKQYRIHKHLFTVSKNKAVALSSFTSFILTIDDKTSKENISLEIAKIIYDPGHSGYLGEKDSDFPSIINNLGVK